MNRLSAEIVTEEIFDLYDRFGGTVHLGETVTQLEHMAQTARLARLMGNDEEVILAAFLHDVGHICAAGYTALKMGEYGIKNHEKIAAGFLRNRGFSKKVLRLVELHVSAKRYLIYKNPAYFEGLSAASKKTLEFQGGIMLDEEVVDFESDPYFETAVELRRWDDLAKEINQDITGELELLKNSMLHHLTRENNKTLQFV